MYKNLTIIKTKGIVKLLYLMSGERSFAITFTHYDEFDAFQAMRMADDGCPHDEPEISEGTIMHAKITEISAQDESSPLNFFIGEDGAKNLERLVTDIDSRNALNEKV